jgi:hypothetical protein
MEYLFLLYADPERVARATAEQVAAAMEAHRTIREDAVSRGVFRGASRLAPPAEGFTVRSRDGALTVSDGPYAETRELLGGYYMIDCADAPEARQWAERLARTGSITAVAVRSLRS